MWQTEHVAERLLERHPGLAIEIVGMTTKGDRILDRPLAEVGGKGLFIKELEIALADNLADVAVHSMKDVPMELPEGFALLPFGPREDARDAFVSLGHASLAALPAGAVVGTSSLRRECQLRRAFPSLVIKPLRGNVNTRLAKLEAGDYDAIILAAAGLKRLGFAERIRELLPLSTALPAIGQGVLAIEFPVGRADIAELLEPFVDAATLAAADAERALGLVVEGSCEVPLGGTRDREWRLSRPRRFSRPARRLAAGARTHRGHGRRCAIPRPRARRAHPRPGRSRRAGSPLATPAMTTAGPLSGLGVVLTRPRAQCEAIAAALEANGARVLIFPALDIVAVELSPASRATLESLPLASLAIFVSANAAEHGVAAARAAGPWPAGVAVAGIGEATAERLRNLGFAHAISPATGFDSDSLLACPELRAVKGRRIVIFRGVGGRERLRTALEERGATVGYVECYRRERPKSDPAGASGSSHARASRRRPCNERRNSGQFPCARRSRGGMVPRGAGGAACGDRPARGLGRLRARRGFRSRHSRPRRGASRTEKGEMSSPLPEPPTLPDSRPPRRAARGSDHGARWAAAIAIVAAAVAIGIAWNAHQALTSLTRSAGGKLADLGAELAQSRTSLAQAQAALRESQARIAEIEGRVTDAQENRVAVEEMYRELSRSADDRMLAEVEQLLILASQQLQLAGNVKGALIALQAADQRLARADKLQVANLRRALNGDMDRLKALPLVDTVGIAVKLDALIQQADTLPMIAAGPVPAARQATRVKAADENAYLRVARDFWEEMKGLVRIREIAPSEAVLLSPAQVYFLRENLKLRLLAARVALLARDESSFRDDIKSSQAWIAKYFDAKARPSIGAQAILKQLAESPVSISPPDINASLSAARTARAAREKR